ncbi:MAG TPA: NTP transferase domain-containing protein, partial [Saprospiraceae bacterium]|nr:NTP transferase domain-containing protein [Saprospiraceae bacterium]
MSGHQKHKKISRAKFGHFSRSEVSFLGAPCGDIEEICKKLAIQSKLNALYIDAKHGETLAKPELHVLEYQQDHWRLTLNDKEDDPYAWRRMTEEYDLSLINGNHFESQQQIICLHPKKFDSLKRKKDKLTRPVAMIDFTGQAKIPNELEEFLSSFKDLPIFNSDQISEITTFVHNQCVASTGVRGVVLTGGRSTRMGEDKSKLKYHGIEQWEHMRDILGTYCDEVVVSVPRNSQSSDPQFIPDRLDNFGPFGGILSCFMDNPNKAHFVVAVDLPYVTGNTIEVLMEHR